MKLNIFPASAAVAVMLLAFGLGSDAHAGLILHVDASAKEVRLTGSDTGTATETAAGDFKFAWFNGDSTGNATLGLGDTVLLVSASTLVKHRLVVSTDGSGGLNV